MGIPEDKLPHIFDRFYQAQSDETREFEGTGIGLALAKELVELHGGTIAVESMEGVGTAFTVRLPVASDRYTEDSGQYTVDSVQFELVREHIPLNPPSKGDFPTSPLEGGQGGVKDDDIATAFEIGQQPTTGDQNPAIRDPQSEIVLVVEDNPDLRAYIRQYLENGYRVLEAKNGEEGLAKAIEHVPDLIISDVMMPVMDGYALCEKLKTDERTSHIPVILLTAKAAREEKLAGLQTGADDYLIKPFDAQELLVRVENLIALRRKLREKYRSENLLEPDASGYGGMEQAFLKRTIALVEENLEDEKFNVEALAEKLHMSRSQLHRKLSALTGRPAVQFIRALRLKFAEDLLKNSTLNVTEIAYRTGFGSQAYFSKIFRQHYGCTPKQFIKQHRE